MDFEEIYNAKIYDELASPFIWGRIVEVEYDENGNPTGAYTVLIRDTHRIVNSIFPLNLGVRVSFAPDEEVILINMRGKLYIFASPPTSYFPESLPMETQTPLTYGEKELKTGHSGITIFGDGETRIEGETTLGATRIVERLGGDQGINETYEKASEEEEDEDPVVYSLNLNHAPFIRMTLRKIYEIMVRTFTISAKKIQQAFHTFSSIGQQITVMVEYIAMAVAKKLILNAKEVKINITGENDLNVSEKTNINHTSDIKANIKDIEIEATDSVKIKAQRLEIEVGNSKLTLDLTEGKLDAPMVKLGSGLEFVLTVSTPCQFTGAPHIPKQYKVYAG